MHSRDKLIFAGNVLHHYRYSKHVKYGEEKPKLKGFSKIWLDGDVDLELEDTPKVDTHVYRVKKAVKLLVESNAYQHWDGSGRCFTPIFVTLTHAEEIKTIAESNPLFKNFTKRLNYEVYGRGNTKLLYLVVPEFQPVSGRVHYHAIYFNLPYIPMVYDFFKDVWSNGFVNVKAVSSIQHLTRYIVKYITKDKRDERLAGKKKYFCSRGLLKPVTFRETELILPFLDKLNLAPDFTGSFSSPDSDLETDYSCYRTKTSHLEEYRQALKDHFSCNDFAKQLAKTPDLKSFKLPRIAQPVWQPETILALERQQNLFLPKPLFP